MRASLAAVALPLALLACSTRPPPRSASPGRLAVGDHRFDVPGGQLVYHVRGEGPVAIAVPGGPGFAWDYLRMPEVERHMTVVYMEPIGTGASSRLADPSGYSLARDAADLERLRALLDVDHVYVIGHSYGGFVALTHALEHQQHLAGLILYDTAPTIGPVFQEEVARNMARYQSQPWFADASAAFAAVDHAKTQAELDALIPRIMPFYVHEYTGHEARWKPYFDSLRLDFGRGVRAPSAPYDVTDRLRLLDVPSLVIVGATDFICSPTMAHLMSDNLRNAHLVVLDGVGHLGHLEQPAAFAEAIASFIR